MAVFLIVMVGEGDRMGAWDLWTAAWPGRFLFVVILLGPSWQKIVPVRVKSLGIAKPAIAFLVLAILSVFFSIYRSNTLIASQSNLIVLIAFVMLVKMTQTMRDVERMFLALVGSAISLTVGVLVNYGGGQAHINDNFDPNDIAYVLDTLLPIVIAYGVAHSKRRKRIAYGLSLMMILAILLTGSRGGVIGLGAVMLVPRLSVELLEDWGTTRVRPGRHDRQACLPRGARGCGLGPAARRHEGPTRDSGGPRARLQRGPAFERQSHANMAPRHPTYPGATDRIRSRLRLGG